MTLTAYTADGRQKNKGQSFANAGTFRAYATGNPNVASGGVVPYNVKDFDPLNWYDAATYRFQPKVAGYYDVKFWVRDSAIGSAGWVRAQLWKNGTTAMADGTFQLGGPDSSNGACIVFLNGTTDYLDVRRYRGDGTTGGIVASAPEHSGFMAELVGTSVGVVPEPWHNVGAVGEPAFQNSWANYGAGQPAVAFFKDPHGIVHLKGLLANGVIAQNAFQMPAGYRPLLTARYGCLNFNGSVWTAAYVSVDNSGALAVNNGSNVWTALEAITFRAEQ